MESPTAEDSPLVLVTGASGYIATHLVQQLQAEGYRVRGTVRSLTNEQKVKPLKDLCPGAKYPLELVEADLTKPESWEGAVDGCTYVMHVASPFPAQNPSHESELIKPAVEGTTSVLRACQKAEVKRVVLTSSMAAVQGGWGESGDKAKVYNEEDWTDVSKAGPYEKSKTLAEKAAWDLVNSMPEEERFEFAVINPCYVLGPILSGSNCTSMEVPKRMLERAMPAIPKLYLHIVDVRDVAAAHIKAMTVPGAVGKRHLLTGGAMWMGDVAQTLAEEFKPQGYDVPTMHCPYPLAYVIGMFDKTVRMIVPAIGKSSNIDNSRMKNVLGVEARPTKDTLIEMCYSMIENGFVKKTKHYKGPPQQEAPGTSSSAS